jgi:sulfatase maturation enzyme AslB (radical SAM superfamily)
MIHGGLELNFKNDGGVAQHCCLRNKKFLIDLNTDYWNSDRFNSLRDINNTNSWATGCENCKNLESAGQVSFRQGMNSKFGIDNKNLSGPLRIDLMFDSSCNLACRTCGPDSSTFWQKHLREHNLASIIPITNTTSSELVFEALKKLDLSNLQMLVFCGGETLLGRGYWKIAKWLADNVPNAKEQLTVCFQTNGTQPIHQQYHDIIKKFHLVKLHISVDGIQEQFEYLRWPASWNQFTDNITNLKETVPSNVMFLLEETISIFNLAYTERLENWIANNFTTNREGDIVHHSRHLAKGIFGLHNLNYEYADEMKKSKYKNLIPEQFGHPVSIKLMLDTINRFDKLRGEKFADTFPEIAKYYSTSLKQLSL